MNTDKFNSNRFTRAAAFAFLCLAALIGTSASAQTTTGTIRGTVTSGGAFVGNAQIQLRNPASGIQR